ncbi:hypothetical protein [Spirobacillus cienkowskii]|jgi:hypothetical protein|uniref:Uncharacterized protein n=1 Tax=Spirobacillus cienkowskii TaxID=495820 RepID=A0A369KRI6_9BACT|nr:MAG: hypothetical protein DCC88_06425 [Spirobacillus cienkowskii]
MVPHQPDNQDNTNKWKQQVNEYFHDISLSMQKKHSLEHLITSATFSQKRRFLHKVKHSFFYKLNFSYFKKNNKFFTHFTTACFSALTTWGSIKFFENVSHDFIIDMVATVQDSRTLPPDFDLVGDASGLPELSLESLPNQAFTPNIPNQLSQFYSASEGRFFLYKGLQGVSINLHSNTNNQSNLLPHPATLYIVKLTKNNLESFPKQKVLKRIRTSSSKVNRVYAWRDDVYGYAMVQNVPSSIENTDLPNLIID